ncbi:MAG: DUF642 domain-containing protein [Rhodocyclaceae bacterium]|nr:DUF642 domain-containing protein [Rhodocyclaceae bacterium]
MNKKLIAAAILALSGAAQADVTVFTDNFDSNGLGLNATPSGWSVSSGTVDIIGNSGFFDFIPGSGRYIDLDGSTSNAGVLSRDFLMTAGTHYTVSFDLAGNHRNGAAESVAVNFGGASANYSLSQNAGWTTFSLVFTPSVTKSYTLSFENSGGDNIGMLLDNVSVHAVPEPETYAMMLAGLGLMGAIARRRRMA